MDEELERENTSLGSEKITGLSFQNYRNNISGSPNIMNVHVNYLPGIHNNMEEVIKLWRIGSKNEIYHPNVYLINDITR